MKIKNKSLRHRFIGEQQVYVGEILDVDDKFAGELIGLDWVEVIEEPKKTEKKKYKKKIITEEKQNGII